MKNILTKLKSPALISLLLVLPFMLLELVNRRNFTEGFPAGLFGLLWLVPVIFLPILMPILRDVRAGTNLIAESDFVFVQHRSLGSPCLDVDGPADRSTALFSRNAKLRLIDV